jgi:hypothetical protein
MLVHYILLLMTIGWYVSLHNMQGTNRAQTLGHRSHSAAIRDPSNTAIVAQDAACAARALEV